MVSAGVFRFDRVLMLVLAVAACSRLSYGQQCIEGPVDGFKVRSVKFSSFLGRVPENLTQKLNAHRGESYSVDKPGQYISEINAFLENDEAQQRYESLIANQLKLSIKGVFTGLECVEKVEPEDCEKAIPGTMQCVDVKIKRYAVEINALNSSPFLLLFPQSAATVLYGAIPRALLALNPSLNVSADRQYGPAIGLETATNLLNLGSVLGKVEPGSPSAAGTQPLNPTPPPAPVAPDSLVIVPISPASEGAVENTPDIEEGSATSLLLRLNGRKSLSEDFYGARGRILLQHRKPPLEGYQGFALETAFDASHVPLGDGDFLRNAGTLSFSNSFRPGSGPMKLLDFGIGYRRSSDRFYDVPSNGQAGMENTFEARVIADGSLGRGLTRAAVWFDRGVMDNDRGSYERIATRVGYGKEFVIHRRKEFRTIRPPELGGRECWTLYPTDPEKNEPTIGVEVIAGGGRTWGAPPPYATFWGGNTQGQFLYDELSAQTLAGVPAGPLLRSFGQNQLDAVTGPASGGGTSYWHSNVNVSFPIPAWSRPLIPHEWVTMSRLGDEDVAFKGHVPADALICRDLKHTIKTLVGKSGVNLLINQEARDQLTDAQKEDLRLRNKENRTQEESVRLQAAETALTAAKAMLKPGIEDLFKREILPITDFVADHANMISVKPLFLFDAAHLGLSGSQTPTRYGAGGGLQVDIVTARFEFAYVAALNRSPGDPPGNFVGRIVLRNFF